MPEKTRRHTKEYPPVSGCEVTPRIWRFQDHYNGIMLLLSRIRDDVQKFYLETDYPDPGEVENLRELRQALEDAAQTYTTGG